MTQMVICKALALVVAADDAFDPNNGGTQYELLDVAIDHVRAVLKRRPNASSPCIEAGRLIVAWDDAEDIAPIAANTDWQRFDEALNAIREVV